MPRSPPPSLGPCRQEPRMPLTPASAYVNRRPGRFSGAGCVSSVRKTVPRPPLFLNSQHPRQGVATRKLYGQRKRGLKNLFLPKLQKFVFFTVRLKNPPKRCADLLTCLLYLLASSSKAFPAFSKHFMLYGFNLLAHYDAHELIQALIQHCYSAFFMAASRC